MDFRQLRYFVAVAEELSFTRAAARLHIGQPPLSLQIKAIEQEVGALLLARTRRRVELTPAGAVFLEKARLALAQVEDAMSDARRVAQGESGALRIGYLTSATQMLAFRRAIRRYRNAFPGVRLDLWHASTTHQIEAVLTDRLDIGFIRPPPHFSLPAQVGSFVVQRDHLAAVLPVEHALAADRDAMTIGELRNEPFVFFPPEAGAGIYEHVTALCREADYDPRIVQAADDATSIVGLVAAGLGVSVLPAALQGGGISDVIFRVLSDANSVSPLLLIFHATVPSPQRQRFLRVVEEELASSAGDELPRRR